MVKRYSKRVYRKRTQRKLRSNRRRRTQKGGIEWGNMLSQAKEAATSAATKAKEAATGVVSNTSIGQSLTKWNNMNFQDKLLEGFGATMTLFVSFSKMVMSLLVSVYIAKVMISNPAAAREILESKKSELMEQHPKVFNCINKALDTVKSPTGSPQVPTDAPPKSLVETLVERKNELQSAPDKIAFMKGLITDKINKMNQDIERIKTNPELKVCFEEASNSVNTKKLELMDKIQADPQINGIIQKIIALKDTLSTFLNKNGPSQSSSQAQ